LTLRVFLMSRRTYTRKCEDIKCHYSNAFARGFIRNSGVVYL
jgi:hypothetical protein